MSIKRTVKALATAIVREAGFPTGGARCLSLKKTKAVAYDFVTAAGGIMTVYFSTQKPEFLARDEFGRQFHGLYHVMKQPRQPIAAAVISVHLNQM